MYNFVGIVLYQECVTTFYTKIRGNSNFPESCLESRIILRKFLVEGEERGWNDNETKCRGYFDVSILVFWLCEIFWKVWWQCIYVNHKNSISIIILENSELLFSSIFLKFKFWIRKSLKIGICMARQKIWEIRLLKILITSWAIEMNGFVMSN